MNERIKDKIEEIENYLEELSMITPDNLESYKEDFKTKAACERYVEKVIEAVIDLIFLIIKEKKLQIPEDDETAFDIIFKSNLISKELAGRLKQAKGMRNIIAHEYGKVDDEIVFNSLKDELEKDVKEFIHCIKVNLETKK